MDFTGTVYERQEAQIATVEVETLGEYLFCNVKVNGNNVIRFPLAIGSDNNEIALRTANIINQTGLVNNSVRVEIEPVP